MCKERSVPGFLVVKQGRVTSMINDLCHSMVYTFTSWRSFKIKKSFWCHQYSALIAAISQTTPHAVIYEGSVTD